MSSVLTALGFGLAAGIAGTTRWYLARLFRRPELTILAINLAGSFFLGLTYNASSTVRLLVGTALLSTFTTYSTFVQNLVRSPNRRAVMLLIGATIFGCVALAWVGIQLAPT